MRSRCVRHWRNCLHIFRTSTISLAATCTTPRMRETPSWCDTMVQRNGEHMHAERVAGLYGKYHPLHPSQHHIVSGRMPDFRQSVSGTIMSALNFISAMIQNVVLQTCTKALICYWNALNRDIVTSSSWLNIPILKRLRVTQRCIPCALRNQWECASVDE